MKKLLVCMLQLSIIACAPPRVEIKDGIPMLIGTYTDGKSEGLYSCLFDQETADAVSVCYAKFENPSYVTCSEDGTKVYAVNEINTTMASIYSFGLDGKTGMLSVLNDRRTLGEDPCYIATNGKVVVTATYNGGSMTVHAIREDGSLDSIDTLFYGKATGPDTIRQKTPHVHCALFSPDGKYIFATDFSSDRILRFDVIPDKVIPRESDEITHVPAGSGPRHLTFSPNGKQAYLINELSGMVIAYNYHDGKLEEIQTIAADTVGARGSAHIQLSHDGKFLYASNRLKADGIAIFAVNGNDGTLTKVGYQPTRRHPRHFNITPNDKFLLVACRDDNAIEIYERDSISGLLKNMDKTLLLDKPVCVQFVPRPKD